MTGAALGPIQSHRGRYIGMGGDSDRDRDCETDSDCDTDCHRDSDLDSDGARGLLQKPSRPREAVPSGRPFQLSHRALESSGRLHSPLRVLVFRIAPPRLLRIYFVCITSV